MTTKKKTTKQVLQAVTKYTTCELAAEAPKLFGTKTFLALAALKADGQKEYTEKEAAKIVDCFRKKEVI